MIMATSERFDLQNIYLRILVHISSRRKTYGSDMIHNAALFVTNGVLRIPSHGHDSFKA